MLRILIADDHPMVRRGLVQSLTARADWDICGEAIDGKQAVDLALAHRPDVVVMDLVMPALNGIEASRQIRQALPDTEVLIHTFRMSEQLVFEAVRAGARGYLLKTDPPELLDRAIDALAQHEPYVTPTLRAPSIEQLLGGRPSRSIRSSLLTDREREIVRLIADGRRSREIAEQLSIAEKTVESHRATIMRKLGLANVAGLVRFALRNELVQE